MTIYKFFQNRNAIPVTPKPQRQAAVWIRESVILLVVVALAVIGGRGGWQRRRLTAAFAQVSDKECLAQLALNSTYTLINSQPKCNASSLTPLRYFPTDDELKRQLPPQPCPSVTPFSMRRTRVSPWDKKRAISGLLRIGITWNHA